MSPTKLNFINLVRFVAILVEMKSKLNYILITSFKSLEITSSSLSKSLFKIMLARPRCNMHEETQMILRWIQVIRVAVILICQVV